MTLTRDQIIDAAVELYGFTHYDFANMSISRIITFLENAYTEYEGHAPLPGEIEARIREYYA